MVKRLRSLRSAGTSRLVVLPSGCQHCDYIWIVLSLTSMLEAFVPFAVYFHQTVDNRTFPTVAAYTWNDLPSDVTSAESLSTFRQRLKTHLFSKSFPGYFLDF